MKTVCDNTEQLVGYLYGELDTAAQRTFSAHLTICGECRSELAALQATRGHIASWAPPEPDLGLRIVRGSAPSRRASRALSLPAWGLAAAAALVLGASAALANLEVRYGGDGLVVRTGWGRAPVAASTETVLQPAAPAPPTAAALPAPDTAALEHRLDALELLLRQQRSADAPQNAASTANGPTNAELMKAVRQMIVDAETRQQRDVALRVAQVINDFDRLRRNDMAILQQGFAQYQGLANAEMATQRDMLIRVAAGRQEK